MRDRRSGNWIPWLLLAIALVGGWMAWPRQAPPPLPVPIGHDVARASHVEPTPEPLPRLELTQPQAETRPHAVPRSTLPDFLPPEAHATIALIERGGPFPHRQDGSVFGNREGRLPRQPRGWYREYTVDTPGLSHRGARRIVTGGNPPREWYYTDDHYDSFRRFDAHGGAQ